MATQKAVQNPEVSPDPVYQTAGGVDFDFSKLGKPEIPADLVVPPQIKAFLQESYTTLKKSNASVLQKTFATSDEAEYFVKMMRMAAQEEKLTFRVKNRKNYKQGTVIYSVTAPEESASQG
jgi:hypothetical protein